MECSINNILRVYNEYRINRNNISYIRVFEERSNYSNYTDYRVISPMERSTQKHNQRDTNKPP